MHSALLASGGHLNGFKGASVLVVGDGDFSFSRSLAEMRICKELVATSIDHASLAKSAFPSAAANTDAVMSSGYEVKYEVDATCIERSFGSRKFDTIAWNFPHWPGKQNSKYNRELLRGFLKSASSALMPAGQIKVALCRGQSGCRAASKVSWDRSWKLLEQAAAAGLLVTDMQPFTPGLFPQYHPQGYRGHGGGFLTGDAQMFTLRHPAEGTSAAMTAIHLHELHLTAPGVRFDLLDLEDRARAAVNQVLGTGCLWSAQLIDLYSCPGEGTNISHVVQLSFGSLTKSISREQADLFREAVEVQVPSMLDMAIRPSRTGRKVSQSCGWYVAKHLRCSPGLRELYEQQPSGDLEALPADLRRVDEQRQSGGSVCMDSEASFVHKLWHRQACFAVRSTVPSQ